MLRHLARFLLWLGGWTAVGKVPDVRKAVFIAAPHTSNWDGFWAIVYITYIGLDAHWFIKKSMFWFPLNRLLTYFGAVPLNRERGGSAVSEAIAAFDKNEQFFLGLAPEGTRRKMEGWKSGFYRIAEGRPDALPQPRTHHAIAIGLRIECAPGPGWLACFRPREVPPIRFPRGRFSRANLFDPRGERMRG